MRYTLINGIDTEYRLDLGGDVDIICAVMKVATRGGELTYEVDMTGEELSKFFSALKVNLEGIISDKNYTVTSYDW